MLTLIIYDITDDELRSKVASFLKSKGLKRIQKSAFIGELSSSERVNVEAGLKLLVKNNDRVNIQIYPLTPAVYNQRSVIGVELNYEEEYLV
ncbi:MAG: CRISPR-associated endonuclease Cas2 [Candidatus Terraquivivens tikiterensis]|uniref:CRISPR-associated endoribonuclease Cas2 n=1 Tax=Candidatus Terraquivivens tikiterensis TaxID=1980982 RepID=A0A2R7Y5K4_9ARCH|nr:MAG: CRISPR-associated endonuclease Cas2 [Candidatus Terraquivivens tikiterensis]